MNNNFYYIENENKKTFFNIPKLFYDKNSKFHKMSSLSKLIYPLLLNKNINSINNSIYDNKGRIYFDVKLNELSLNLNSTETDIFNSLVELSDYKLLFLLKNNTNKFFRIYLLNIDFNIKNVSTSNKEILSNSKIDLRVKKFLNLHNNLFSYKLSKKNQEYLIDFIKNNDDDYIQLLFENQSEFTKSFSGLKFAIERYKNENILTKESLNLSILNHKKHLDKNCYNNKIKNFKEKNYDYDKLERELLGWE